MSESDATIRIRALERLLAQERARREALEKRLVQAEQSLSQRWNNAGSS